MDWKAPLRWAGRTALWRWVCFAAACDWLAICETRRWVRRRSKPEVGIYIVLGAAFWWRVRGLDAMKEELVSVLLWSPPFVVALIGVYLWNLVTSPMKLHEDRQATSRRAAMVEIDAIITALEAESLLYRDVNTNRRIQCTMTQLFLAGADHFSVGATETMLNTALKEGLGIPGHEYWVLDADGVVRLLGRLYQWGLVERHDEAYEQQVPDRSVLPSPVFSVTGTTLAHPPHTSKGTTTRFRLTPLGAEVIKQLRERSIARMADSPTARAE
jgi:hypothetical protein